MNNTNLNREQNSVLDIKTPGMLDSFYFRPLPRVKPGPGEVEIEVCASGINFKDVLMALGMLGPSIEMGFECTGRISAVGEGVKEFSIGDEVIVGGNNGFRSYVISPIVAVAHKPPHLSFAEATTIPVAFMTAYFSFVNLAKLSKGEKVLIHSAAGGVGLSAIKVAQWIGAEIFATAGNNEKRAYLRSLGIKYVMDSRSDSFANQVMEFTNGKGVDVVLNSLSGKLSIKSLYLLGVFGRFIEIGMRDMYSNAKLDSRPFLNNLTYFSLLLRHDQEGYMDSWHEVEDHFRNRVFTPIPLRTYSFDQAAEAFQYMTKGIHIGKVVLVHPDKM